MERENSNIVPIEFMRVEYDKDMNVICEKPVKAYKRGKAIIVPPSSFCEIDPRYKWWEQ